MDSATANPAGTCATLVELLRWRAAVQPQQISYTFLRDSDGCAESVTYAALDEQARALAVCLEAAGARGERVLVLYPPGLKYIAAFFGCLYAGATAVPAVSPRPHRPMARLQTIWR